MAIKKSRDKAVDKYRQEQYERIQPYVLKGKKIVYKKVADKKGVSLNKYIEDLLDADAARNGFEEDIRRINGGELTRDRKDIIKSDI